MAEEILPAESFFNRNFGIRSGDLEKVLATALGRRADYADLYFEYRRNEGISLEEGLVKNCSQSTANGVGVRVLAETKTGYAYTDDITIENLELAARTAQYIAQNQQSQLPVSVGQSSDKAHDLYAIKVPVNDIVLDQKVALLYEIDKFTRGLDARVKNVFVSLASEYKVILVASSHGLVVGDIQPLTRLNVTCIAEEDGDRQVGSFGGGGRVEFGFFIDAKDYERYAREAVRQAILNLSALDAPAGTMDVVLGPGWPGILLHEAIGHGLEATSTGSRLPLSVAESVNGSPPSSVPWLTMARFLRGADPSMSTTKVHRHTGRFSSKMVFSTAISKIVSTRRS